MDKVTELPAIDWDQQEEYSRSVREAHQYNQKIEKGQIRGERRQIPKPPIGWMQRAQADRMVWETLREIVQSYNVMCEKMSQLEAELAALKKK